MMKAVCAKHYDRGDTVEGCPTCVRIRMEHRIVERTVETLLAAGYQIKEAETSQPFTTDPAKVLPILFDLDDAFLVVGKEGYKKGWVRFVFGNDGWDVISDYTTNLEGVLRPVNDYIDSVAP